LREGFGVFHSPPFIPLLYVKLERGNNSKRNYPHRPSLFQKRGDGGELREGCGGEHRGIKEGRWRIYCRIAILLMKYMKSKKQISPSK